jgi:hypothetical protein
MRVVKSYYFRLSRVKVEVRVMVMVRFRVTVKARLAGGRMTV